jgi:hypothetical protein
MRYTFDMTLAAAFTVEAASEDEARRIIADALDAATCGIIDHTGEIGLTGEVSLVGDKPDEQMTLAMIDGKDV